MFFFWGGGGLIPYKFPMKNSGDENHRFWGKLLENVCSFSVETSTPAHVLCGDSDLHIFHVLPDGGDAQIPGHRI